MNILVVDLNSKRVSAALTSAFLVIIIVLASIVGVSYKIFGENIISAMAGTSPSEKIIIIDAGHGGEDSGAVGVTGVLEKDLNLQMALQIGSEFEERGYVVVSTRTDDRLLYTEDENIYGIRKISDLKNRVKVAEKYPDAILVSIHMNSFGSGKYSGLQVYYSTNKDESKDLADSIQSKVATELQKDNKREIKSGKDMYILEHVNNTAVLIECGFLTNEAECKKISEKEYQNQLSFSIVCGIIEYIEKNQK